MSNINAFISSTFEDLKTHRLAVWEMLSKRKDVRVRGMEDFGARSEAPIETCLAAVEQADVYIGIIGFRLGSIDPKSGKSFTQIEYEHAVELEKPRLLYIADEESAMFPASAFENNTRRQSKLKAFKKTLFDNQVIQMFTSAEDLAEKIRRDFQREFPIPAPEAAVGDDSDFATSLTTIREFRLTPKRFNGTEVRLLVTFQGGPFPASRALCKQFNLEYGATIGCYVKIIKPAEPGLTAGLSEIYATGKRVDILRAMKADKNGDLYASLFFSAEDVKRPYAEFIARSYDPGDDFDPSDDDGSVYIPAEGKVLMIFTKKA